MHFGKHTTLLLESRIHFLCQLNAWACRVRLKRETTQVLQLVSATLKKFTKGSMSFRY